MLAVSQENKSKIAAFIFGWHRHLDKEGA